MLSFKTAQLLKELLHQQLLLEEELDRMRVTLCQIEDFEPHAAFQAICVDSTRRGRSGRDIQRFLIQNRFNQPHEGCCLFVIRHSHEKSQATELYFSDFLESVLPVSEERLREETAQRVWHVDQSKCCFESEIKLSELLNHEISNLLKLERLKDDLANSCEGFSINACFRAIDPEGLGFIDQDALSNFMKKNGCMIPAIRLPMLLRSISGKQNGVIELKQFTQFIRVCFPELIASKYRPLPATCYYPSIDDYTTFYLNRPYLSGRAVKKGDQGEAEEKGYRNGKQLICSSSKSEITKKNDRNEDNEVDSKSEIEQQNERELKDRQELEEEEREVLEQELKDGEEEDYERDEDEENQGRKVEEVDEDDQLREGQDLEDEEDDDDQNNEEQNQLEEQDNQDNYQEEEDQRERYQDEQPVDKIPQKTMVQQSLSPKQQAQKGINEFLQSLKNLISLNRACETAKLEFLSISYFSPKDLFNFALSFVHDKRKPAGISSTKTYYSQSITKLSQTQNSNHSQQNHSSSNKHLPQTLTQTEFRNFLRDCINCPSLDDSQIARIFHQIDTSNQGEIDHGKFIDFLAPSDPFVILHRQLAPITELTKLEKQRLLELFVAVLDYLVELQNIKEAYSKPVSVASARSNSTPSLFQIFDYIDQDSDEYISIKDLEISLTEADIPFDAADLSFLMVILSKNNNNPLSRHQKLSTSKNHLSLISITMFISAFNM